MEQPDTEAARAELAAAERRARESAKLVEAATRGVTALREVRERNGFTDRFHAILRGAH